MAEDAKGKRRTLLSDLTPPEEEVGAEELKKIQGGATRIVRNPLGGNATVTEEDATRKTDGV